jgi:hypothetical protein
VSAPAGAVTGSGSAPGSPAGLKADAGDGFIALSWSPPTTTGSSPVTGYHVYLGYSSSLVGAREFTTSDPSFRLTDATNGSLYYIKVTALNAAGEGPATPVTSVFTGPRAVPTRPVAPSGLTARVSHRTGPGQRLVRPAYPPDRAAGGAGRGRGGGRRDGGHAAPAPAPRPAVPPGARASAAARRPAGRADWRTVRYLEMASLAGAGAGRRADAFYAAFLCSACTGSARCSSMNCSRITLGPNGHVCSILAQMRNATTPRPVQASMILMADQPAPWKM